MNVPHFQSALLGSSVFTDFSATAFLDVILSEAKNLKIVF